MIPEWEKVKKENTEQAYKRFIVKYPYCKYADNARELLSVYDEAYWKKTLGINSSSAFKDYIEHYPDGIHSKEAKKKIIDIKVDNILNLAYEPIPALNNKNNSYYSKVSLVSIKNNSPYRLTVFYSGTESREVEIEPMSAADIRLPNGTYRVAATANVISVKNFGGTQLLEGSVYELNFFIPQKH
jgi:hypothetical protein